MKDKFTLYGLLVFGIVLLPIALNKKPKKDWIIVFLLKAIIASLLGNIIAAKKWLEFPIRLFPGAFKSSVLYDNLLFPLLCVFYNQTSYKSKSISIISQAFIYSIPITFIEYILERKTNLIKYHQWTWYYTLFSLTGTFLLVRGAIAYIRKITHTESPENMPS